MAAYRELYNILEASFEGCELKHIGRGSNEEADTLENIGSTCSPIPEGVFYEVINKRSIKYKPLGNSTTSMKDTQGGPEIVDKNVVHEPVEQIFLVEPLW